MKKLSAIAVAAIILCGLCLRNASAQDKTTMQDKVTFSPQTPSQITAGETFTATITLSKPKIKGKFSVVLMPPEGVAIREIPNLSAKAEFVWDGMNAEYKWEKLSESEVDLSFDVDVPAGYQGGELKIEGVFMYYERRNKLRQQFALPVVSVKKKEIAAPKIVDQHRITLKANMPSETPAGAGFQVVLNIGKAGIAGKFRIIFSMPEETLFEEMENSGAMLLWDGIQADYRWDDNANEHINISYAVSPSAELKDAFTTSVLIIYHMNGEEYREYHNLPNVKILSDENETPPPDTSAAANIPDATPSIFGMMDRVAPVDAANIYAVRQTPYAEGGTIAVRLQINKGAFNGYGRLEELVSPVARINLIEAKGANVDIYEREGVIAFIWQQMPAGDSITLMYEIAATDPTLYKFDGYFYFENGQILDSVAVEQRSIFITKDLPVPDDMAMPEVSPNAPVIDKKPRPEKKNDANAKDDQIKKCNNNQKLVYRIQIMAAKREQTQKELKAYLHKTGADTYIDVNDVCVDFVESDPNFDRMDVPKNDIRRKFNYKYLVGGHFRTYEEASNLRDGLQRVMGYEPLSAGSPIGAKPLPRAFIVCYSNGWRIDIQQALLVQRGRRYEY